jgi:carbon monoxide dehydrogenase subunit G
MMELTGQERIAAPRAQVWQALNDPEILKACIPGCESIELTSPTDMKARITLRLGPIKASFSGQVTLSNVDPNGYRFQRSSRLARARGSADVRLAGTRRQPLHRVTSQVTKQDQQRIASW